MVQVQNHLANLSAQQKQQLLARLLQKESREGSTNLTVEQRRLWLLRQLEESVPTHIFKAFQIDGHINLEVLHASLDEIGRRHEMLRVSFIDLDGRPVRVIAPRVELRLPLIDLSHYKPEKRDLEIQKQAVCDGQRPFDVSVAPLLRLTLIRKTANQHVLLITMHELIADDRSVAILLHELMAVYEALLDGTHAPAPDSPVRYGDFAKWQHEWLQNSEYPRQLTYWQTQLADAPVLELLSDRPRPAVRTHNGARISGLLPAETVSKLEELADSNVVPLSTVLLTAFQVFLSLYSGQDDVSVGLSSVSRHRAEFKDVIGPLTNIVVMRADLADDPSFKQLLEQVKGRAVQAYRHREMPFDKLVEELHPQRDLSRTPLFQAKLIFRESVDVMIEGRTLKCKWIDVDLGTALFDLTLLVTPAPDGLLLGIEFNTDLFDATTIERMLEQLRTLCRNIVANPHQRISEVAGVNDAERFHLLNEWNSTKATLANDRCLHELIEWQAERQPEAVAVVFDGQQLTYDELNSRANQLAHYLRDLGVGPEVRVGICLEKGPAMVVGMLGVLKAGGAYVPLDPAYPRERLEFMAQDSQVEVILTQQDLPERPETARRVVCLDSDWEHIAGFPVNNPENQVTPDNLAYIIYTSGSTGRPKGVMITHRGVVNNLHWRQSQWPLTPADRVLQSYSFSFDPSVWATFWPLLAGACIILPQSGGNLDSVALARSMVQHGVTVYGAAPSVHSVLIDEPAFQACSSLRYVFSGGELLEGYLQRQVHQHLSAELYNVYGPTEATIDCTYWHCPRVPEPAPAPIGVPIANTSIYVMDRHLELNPIGAPGEICIGGVGLARGYAGDPALTAEKFLPDPFSTVPGARMYRTGDRGAWMGSGVLRFIGRADDQVKVRGFRIELAEVERNLMRHDKIREAAVIVKRNSAANSSLIAYFTPSNSEDTPTSTELAELLEVRLPKYMIPDVFVPLEILPRTATGKINKQLLTAEADPRKKTERAFRPPRDVLETEISQIVESVLDLEQVSIDDDIFDLGSNSLLIARIASRLSSAYKIDLPVQHIFKDPTVAGIAALVDIYQREGNYGVTAWTIEQVEADAELAAAITAEGLPPFAPGTPQRIFLTGATGYLGAFMLEQLLRTSNVECCCLVRASSREKGFDRIREAMQGYHIWDDSFAARIHPVLGDIAKPELGIGQQEFAELAREVDVIYHCAALVNFIYPYSALRAPNVRGTHEVLRLATSVKLKPVHYTSTVDVLLGTHMQRPFYEGDESVLNNPNEIPDGYGRSKLVAEKMLANARARGVPVTVYRPGLIMGHTTTGATQTNDYLLVGLKGYIDLGMLGEPNIMIDFVTVDFVAAAIVHLSRQPESLGRFFHIWNPRPVHMGRAYDWIDSFGYHLKIVPASVLKEKVLKEVDVSSVLYPFLPLFRALRDNPPISSHDPRVMEKINLFDECLNTIEGLKGSGIEFSSLDEEQAHRCLSYLVSIGFLPKPTGYSEQLN
ncbi:MAG TPA: amino acid adenylation domain-containing protein [Pyrinomonadaceae bacterium]|jgi:amino acid adenylation domain-containing protein/thioester reductase-like protein|nr:amino acid adenylation domain-containing protein [Pyrinomonadaceae bacterium]